MGWAEQLVTRSTGELIVLGLAATIALSVLATGLTIAILEINNPDVDTSQAVSILSDVINTLIGVMAGFLAGRTESTVTPR